MLKKIESLNQKFSDDELLSVQDFISFGAIEKESLMNAKKKLNFPKGRTIGIACQFLLEEIEKEEKQNNKGERNEKE